MKFSLIATGLIASLSAVSGSLINIGSGDCAFLTASKIVNLVNLGQTEGNACKCAVGKNGSGIVAGLANFSTKNGDLLQVVEQFTQTSGYLGEFDGVLATLKQVASSATGTVAGLDGLCDAWTKASDNKDFYSSQLKVSELLYKLPVTKLIAELGAKNQLTQAVLFDTALLQGVTGIVDTAVGVVEGVVDGVAGGVVGLLESLISKTNASFTKDVAGTSGNTLLINGLHIDELEWVKAFLNIRSDLGLVSNLTSGLLDTTSIYQSLLSQGGLLSTVVSLVNTVGSLVTINCSPLLQL